MTFADLPHEIRSYLLKGVVRGTQILTVLDTGQKAYIVSNNYRLFLWRLAVATISKLNFQKINCHYTLRNDNP